jgi:hypothetical protein
MTWIKSWVLDFWRYKTNPPHTQKEISENLGLLANGLTFAGVVALAVATYRVSSDWIPFEFLKFGVGAFLLLFTYVLIKIRSQKASIAGNITFGIGAGMLIASVIIRSNIDESTIGPLQVYTGTLIPALVIFIIFPWLLRTFVAVPFVLLWYGYLSYYFDIDQRIAVTSVFLPLSFIWFWQELISGDLILENFTDAVPILCVRLLSVFTRRVMAFSVKAVKQIIGLPDNMGIHSLPADCLLNVTVTTQEGQDERVIPYIGLSAYHVDTTFHQFSKDQLDVYPLSDIKSVEITSTNYDYNAHFGKNCFKHKRGYLQIKKPEK